MEGIRRSMHVLWARVGRSASKYAPTRWTLFPDWKTGRLHHASGRGARPIPGTLLSTSLATYPRSTLDSSRLHASAVVFLGAHSAVISVSLHGFPATVPSRGLLSDGWVGLNKGHGEPGGSKPLLRPPSPATHALQWHSSNVGVCPCACLTPSGCGPGMPKGVLSLIQASLVTGRDGESRAPPRLTERQAS